MRTASALTRNCGYVTKLSKLRPRSAYVQGTMEEGTRFGKLVQDWIEGRDPQPPEVLDEPYAWFETLKQVWAPPPGTECEVAMGLGLNGDYIEVKEVEPHVYEPVSLIMSGCLATAGRADVVWLDPAVDYRGYPTTVCVGDFKRSAWRYGAPSQVPQLMALGCAAARKHGVYFIRLGLYDARDGFWTWDDPVHIDDLLPEVMEMAALFEDEPRPGPWCGGCYERKGCEAAETP